MRDPILKQAQNLLTSQLRQEKVAPVGNIIEEEEDTKKVAVEGQRQLIAKRLSTYKRAAEYLKMVSIDGL